MFAWKLVQAADAMQTPMNASQAKHTQAASSFGQDKNTAANAMQSIRPRTCEVRRLWLRAFHSVNISSMFTIWDFLHNSAGC